MAVRVNSIQSPKEEMAELREMIEHEKDVRRSLRISLREDYFKSQEAYLQEQIALLQSKLDTLRLRYSTGQSQLEESYKRQVRYECRYATLKHRDKINKFHEMKETLERLQREIVA